MVDIPIHLTVLRERVWCEKEMKTLSVVPSIICACGQKDCLYVHLKICLISENSGREFGSGCSAWRDCVEWEGVRRVMLCVCVRVALCTGSSILHPAQFRVACCRVSRYRIFCTEQHCRDTMYPEEPVRERYTHLRLHHAWQRTNTLTQTHNFYIYHSYT